MSAFTIQNVTAAIVTSVLNELRQQGAEITEPQQGSYGIVGNGITASALFVGGVLRVTIHDKPFLVPASMIESRVRDAVERARRG